MKKLKMGVIGTGRMGQNHVRNIAQEIQYFEFVGIYDANTEQAERIANQYDVKAYREFDKLLKDVEAVVVAVPSSLHKEIGLEVARAGVHALIEKPLATNVEDAQALVKAFKEKNLKLAVGHIERFNPVMLELKKIINPDKIFFIEAHRYSPFSGSGHITDVSVVEDLMIHDVDLACHLMDPYNVTNIRGCGEFVRTEKPDFATCILNYGDRAHAVINASRVSQSKERSFNIHIDDSCIYADLLTRTLTITKNTNMIMNGLDANFYTQDGIVQRIFVPSAEPLRTELIAFQKAVTENESIMVDGEVGIEAVRICAEVIRGLKREKQTEVEK